MLDSYNKDICLLATHIELLFLAYIDKSKPLAEFLFLKRLNALKGSNILKHLEE